MFQISSKRIAAATAPAALSISVFAQASFAANLDSATVPSNAGDQPVLQQRMPADAQVGQSFTAPYIVSHTTDGWELDYGGPAIQFEATGE